MPARQIEIQFPLKGLNESRSFMRQAGGQDGTHTTAKCENVVGFDPTTGRNRGAARAGTRKYCPSRISGASAGQCLVHIVGTTDNASRETGPNSSPVEVRLTASGAVRDLGPSTPLVTGARTTTLVGVANGTVGLITTTGITAIGGGTAALSSSRKVIFAEPFFQDIYFCDGANYKYYDVSANQMVPWTATTGGAMPAQESNVQAITGATNATPIVITIASHELTNGDQVTIAGVLGNTAANAAIWTIANVTTNSFELATSVGNGAYISGGTCSRLSGSRCSLIAVWGGRIVLSGLETDPNNIFMSAVGDPFDFDYAPAASTVQQAVAGNVTSGYGKNPDIVTALIPYTDDVLLIGGSHSIRRQIGNPSEGGINASVTEITGIAYGSAWCQTPEGVIYFFGSRGGVYRIDPEAGVPTRITSMTIDERLADINLDDNLVTLEWDDRSLAVRVYITPINGDAATHYVWDVRNEAWWPFSYTIDEHNPLSCHLMSGNAASDRSILEYGQDGYVRMVDVDSTSDDGNPISSFVYLGPFSGMMFVEIYATLRENSGSVTWSICSASSMEKALTAAPKQTGRFIGGRNASQWPRAFLEQGYLRLSSTGPWAMESLAVSVEQVSETMKRIMRSIP